MPKIEQEDEDDFVEEEQDEDEDELEVPAPRKPVKKVSSKPIAKAPAQPKRRFGIVAPEGMKIVDTEANEVVGEGEYLIPQLLTDIIERLERIETTIGAITNN